MASSMPQPYCTCAPLLCATVLLLAASRKAQCVRKSSGSRSRLMLVRALQDTALQQQRDSLHMDRRHSSYARYEGKERRHLGWVRTERIYQYREFFTYYLLSHTHPCLYQATQHVSPGTEGPPVHNTSKWLPRESQTNGGHLREDTQLFH